MRRINFRSTLAVGRHGFLALVALTIWCAIGATPAHAVQTSIMDYEAALTASSSGVNLHCHPPHNECSSIVAANELTLGLEPGSIKLIAKIGDIGDNGPGTAQEVQSPFNGVTLAPTWNCVDAGGASDGCTLQLNFAGLDGDWQIVKIIAKTGKIGSSNDDDKDGVFVRSNALLTTGIDDLQAAFISEAERDAWFTAIGGTGNNGKYSHVYVFGVEAEQPNPPTERVPEPGTLMLLGLGLAGVGFARKLRR